MKIVMGLLSSEPSSVFVVLAHPRPGSFNHAVADRVVGVLAQEMTVHFHDLYAEGFDPLIRPAETWTSDSSADEVLAASNDPVLLEHRRQLQKASALVVIHPNWWGKPPAIMAGWMDRVLVPGVAYRLDEAGGAPQSLLRLSRLLVINTSDTSAQREAELFGDPLQLIWARCLPPYIGNPTVDRIVFRIVAEADVRERQDWLDQVAASAMPLTEAP